VADGADLRSCQQEHKWLLAGRGPHLEADASRMVQNKLTELIRFLNAFEAEVPAGKIVDIILDN
jgi:hypothetical protein